MCSPWLKQHLWWSGYHACLPWVENVLASGTGSIPVGCNLFQNVIALLKKRRENARTWIFSKKKSSCSTKYWPVHKLMVFLLNHHKYFYAEAYEIVKGSLLDKQVTTAMQSNSRQLRQPWRTFLTTRLNIWEKLTRDRHWRARREHWIRSWRNWGVI